MRNDALRPLQRDIGLLEVSSDHAGLAIDRHAQGSLRGRKAFRWHAYASGAASEAMEKRAGRGGLEQQAAFGIGDGDGAVQHGFEYGVEWKLRMQQHGRFEEQIEFAEADGRRFAGGYASHAGEKVLNRDLRGGGVEYDLIGILDTERDHVAFLQNPLGDSLAVDKNTELISAILQKVLAALKENRRAVARNAAVRNGKLISHFAAANRKRRLGKRAPTGECFQAKRVRGRLRRGLGRLA